MAQFSGEPRTIWLSHGGDDRRMQLIDDFWFKDRNGKQWDARAGTIVDGATIPGALWTLVGSPYTGEYRRASIVHDVACVAAQDADDRKRADKMFYEACRAGGCSWRESVILYVGVRIGAWYGNALQQSEDLAPVLTRDELDLQLEDDLRAIADRVLAEGENDDADVVEARTDDAGRKVVARRLLAQGALVKSIAGA